MKLFETGSLIIAIVVAIAAIIGIISSKYLGDDNIIEEIAEAIIKKETGLDIDLTPDSIKKEQENHQQEQEKSEEQNKKDTQETNNIINTPNPK